jgi:hypothetical protein
MSKTNFIKGLFIITALLFPVAAAAQIGGVRDRQVRTLLARIETRTDTFRREVDLSLNRSPLNSTNREDRISDFVGDFETATDALRRGFDTNRNVDNEVNEVLNRAVFINRFMTRNRLGYRAQSEWSALRTDLDTLARLYSVSWNWNRIPDYGTGTGTGGGYGTGTGGGYGRGR